MSKHRNVKLTEGIMLTVMLLSIVIINVGATFIDTTVPRTNFISAPYVDELKELPSITNNMVLAAIESREQELLAKEDERTENIMERKTEERNDGFVYLPNIGLSEELQRRAYDLTLQYGVIDYPTFLGLMYHESKFTPQIKSSTNDYGICQINIRNIKWMANALGVSTDEVKNNPWYNMEGCMLMWKRLVDGYGTNVTHNLMRYNQGPGGASSNIRNGITSKYARAVMANAQNFELMLTE